MNGTILKTSLRRFHSIKAKECLTLILTLCLVIVLILKAHILGKGFNSRGVSFFVEFLLTSLHPSFEGPFLLIVLKSTFFTIGMALISVSISILAGFCFGLLSSKIFWTSLTGRQKLRFQYIWRLALSIFRSVPDLLWGLFMINYFGLSPLSGILAIVIPYSSVTGKVFGDLIDSHNLKNYQAITNAGVHPIKAMLYSLIPDIFQEFVIYSFYRLDSSLRSSVVLGLIGLGGLGYQIMLSFQSLNFREIWTLIYVIALVGYFFEYSSTRIRNYQSKVNGWFFKISLSAVAIVSIITFCLDWNWPLRSLTLKQGFSAGKLLTIVSSTLNALIQTKWSTVLFSTTQTVVMTLIALVIAAVASLVFAITVSKLSKYTVALENISSFKARGLLIEANLLRVMLTVIRSIPPPIWALLFLYLVYPSVLTGALALGIYNAGILGKLMCESFENINLRPVQAIHRYGVTYLTTLFYGIMPQVFSKFVFYSLYRFEIILRDTILIAYIGAPGLGRDIIDHLTIFDYQGMLPSLLAFICIGFIVDLASPLYKKRFLLL